MAQSGFNPLPQIRGCRLTSGSEVMLVMGERLTVYLINIHCATRLCLRAWVLVLMIIVHNCILYPIGTLLQHDGGRNDCASGFRAICGVCTGHE